MMTVPHTRPAPSLRFPALAVAALLAASVAVGADESRTAAAAREGAAPTLVELERAILDDAAWLAEADRLMDELWDLDVRMFTLVGSAGGEEARRRLIRERNNVRRLIIELTDARNTVHHRLNENRLLRAQMDMAAGIHRSVNY